jgi:lipopolysaccharide export system ATP-binding protein
MRLSADSISIVLGDHKILSGVYLEGTSGDIIGILGRNGSGKSTLLKSLMGLNSHSLGIVRIDGSCPSRRERLRQFAYLPQEGFLPRDLHVRNGIALVSPKLLGDTVLSRDERAADMMDRRAATLSSGELRYIECLAVLSMEKPIILLDEPFSQIEPLYCELLRKYIRDNLGSRIAIVTDHLYYEVQKICTQIKILREGTLLATKPDDRGLMDSGYLANDEKSGIAEHSS